MKRHLFSSGEVMYQKNEKQLLEGMLLGSALEYDEVAPETSYICSGTLNGNEIKIRFILEEEEFESIKNRYMFNILMQSDIFLARWKKYEIIA